MIRINSRCPGQVYETVQEDSVQYEAGLGDDTFEYQYGEDEEKYEDEANDTLMDEEQPNGATSPMRRTPISMRSTGSWRPQARDWRPQFNLVDTTPTHRLHQLPRSHKAGYIHQ